MPPPSGARSGLARAKVRLERDDAGRPATLVYPASRNEEQFSFDLAFLADAPDAVAIAEAIGRRYPSDKAQKTVELAVGALRKDWFPFLRARGLDELRLTDVTRRHIESFKAWLDARSGAARGTIKFRAGILTAVQRVLFATGAVPAAARLRGAYRGSHRATKPRQALVQEEGLRLHDAASAETARLMRLRNALCRRGRGADALAPSERAVVAAATWLRERAAERGVIGRGPATILRAGGRTRDAGPLADLSPADQALAAGLVWPGPEHLAGPATLMAIRFRLDAQTLRDLHLGTDTDGVPTIRVDDELGDARMEVVVWKTRKKDWHRASYPIDPDEEVDARSLLEFLRDWTEDLRAHAPPRLANRLLLVIGGPAANTACEFDGARFRTPLSDLARRADVAGNATASLLKRIAICIVDERTDGDADMRTAVGGHGAQVSETSYVSDEAALRHAEALAEGMVVRDRRLAMGGRADPRHALGGEQATSATPGWRCGDPFDSPMPWLRPGDLCDAYGRCPACQKVRPDYGSPIAYARAKKLFEHIMESEAELGVDFVGIWASVADEILHRHMPLFTQAAKDEGAKIVLPPMMSLSW